VAASRIVDWPSPAERSFSLSTPCLVSEVGDVQVSPEKARGARGDGSTNPPLWTGARERCCPERLGDEGLPARGGPEIYRLMVRRYGFTDRYKPVAPYGHGGMGGPGRVCPDGRGA
jgi:hypothetical protein